MTSHESDDGQSRPYYAAGRVVDYREQDQVAVFRVQKSDQSWSVVSNFAQDHPGMVIYREPFADRPQLGTHLDVKRGEQPAIDRKILDMEIKREEGRRFLVAGYAGNDADNPRMVRFNDGRDFLGRGEERMSWPLNRHGVRLGTQPTRYFVIERDEKIPGIGRVVSEFANKPQAQADAGRLEVDLAQKRNQELLRQDDGQSLSPINQSEARRIAQTEWWRREGAALRERNEQQPPMKPKL